MFEPNLTYSHCILSHTHCLSRSLSPTRLTLLIARRPYVIDWPCFLPRTKYIYTSVTGSSLKLYLTALTLAKSSIGQYLPEHIYLFNECRTTLTLSLYLYVSRLTSRSHVVSSTHWNYLSIPRKAGAIYIARGHSILGLIRVGIYSGRFRLYFRSIRPTHYSKHRCNPCNSPSWFPSSSVIALSHVLSCLQRRTMVLLQKTLLFSLIIINKVQNYTPIVHLEWNKFRPTN